MQRRLFLQGLAGVFAAPAIVKAENLMKIFVPKQELILPPGLMDSNVLVEPSSFTLSWPVADNVAVIGYEISMNDGETWMPAGNESSILVSGLKPSSGHNVRVRAMDSAGRYADGTYAHPKRSMAKKEVQQTQQAQLSPMLQRMLRSNGF